MKKILPAGALARITARLKSAFGPAFSYGSIGKQITRRDVTDGNYPALAPHPPRLVASRAALPVLTWFHELHRRGLLACAHDERALATELLGGKAGRWLLPMDRLQVQEEVEEDWLKAVHICSQLQLNTHAARAAVVALGTDPVDAAALQAVAFQLALPAADVDATPARRRIRTP
jgi:hypothetical protein